MTVDRAATPLADAPYRPPVRRAVPRRRPEREIVAEAINYLRGLPQGYAWKIHGGAMGNVGEPDLDACVRGRTCKFEAKGMGNRPNQTQVAAMRRWAGVGALVGWFRELSHVRDLLDHLDEPNFTPDLDHPGCHCPRHDGGRQP